jgi:lipoyl(octanoyl) transferase
LSEALETWRLIDDATMTGRENMARDEAEALCSSPGTPAATLRLYRFDPPAVTIGRFQRVEDTVDLPACEREGVTVVRRATGGLAILHLEDFTYSVVMRSRGGRVPGRRECFDSVAKGILSALMSLGVEASQVEHARTEARDGAWCLEGILGVDLEWNGRKICGSAQRVFAGAVLQHGSLFLKDEAETMARISAGGRRSGGSVGRFASVEEAAGREVTREELATAFKSGFEGALGIRLEPGKLTDPELELAEELGRRKYGREEWNVGRGPESRGSGL